MLGSSRPRSRTGLWFAAFTIISLLMLLASRTEPAGRLQQVGSRVLDPVREVVAGAGQGVAGLFGTIGEIDRLRGENDQLRRQLDAAQQRVAELAEAAQENGELRQLLGLTKALDMRLLPVRVVSRDPSNFTWEVGIDAGSDQGVEEGMPVVGAAEGGAGALAGTVVSVGTDTARVRFIVDTRSSVIAIDQQSRALGLAQGQLGGQLVMVNVQATDALAEQDTIVSAGLSIGTSAGVDVRSAYPKGLLIGRVQAIEPDANALTKTAFVRPAIDFMKVDRLMVVTSFTQS
jgi:rod shape-determining protein MreC